MKIYKNKEFHRWAKKLGIGDEFLLKAINEMSQGLYDVNLGGGVYKKRIPYSNKGKSGGARTILAFQMNKKAFYMYGFAKNKLANINNKELEALKNLAKVYFEFTQKQMEVAIDGGEIIEVKNEKIYT